MGVQLRVGGTTSNSLALKYASSRSTQAMSWQWMILVIAMCAQLALGDGLPKLAGQERSSTVLKSPEARDVQVGLLEVFQVTPPVLTPSHPDPNDFVGGGSLAASTAIQKRADCLETVLLMDHVFAFSYGQPFVGNYTPPTCDFNRVVFNFSATSRGRQFDRLGLMYLGDTEIWRTSTAEPTANGIHWSYVKDMTNYLSLFKEPQKIIFDLGNLIDSTYTGTFNTTLTATFFQGDELSTVPPADQIFPISGRKSASNAASTFTLPDDTAANDITLPRNIKSAVATISTSGNANEEFWFGNVLQSNVDTFGGAAEELLGLSPFREVQLYIDDKLVGVAWPFPIVFTGGVVPGLWRPVVGIDAYDLREYEISLDPWLPLLCDGASHKFEIKVTGVDDDGKGTGTLAETTGENWLTTGKVFVWLDTEGSVTTGEAPTVYLPDINLTLGSVVTKNSSGGNDTLFYHIYANRTLSINTTITTSKGSHLATWSQALGYNNTGIFNNGGNTQFTVQTTDGLDYSSAGYSKTYHYPVTVNTTYAVDASGNFSIDAVIDRTKEISQVGDGVFPSGLQSFAAAKYKTSVAPYVGTRLVTRQNGTAHYKASGSVAVGSGTTEQTMLFSGLKTPSTQAGSFELYQRHVLASNGTVLNDKESLFGQPIGDYSLPSSIHTSTQVPFIARSVKELLGRGPGVILGMNKQIGRV
jgi:Peptide N-acetyl-beta-D-glucosaminyl asparaginase amidase A